MDLDTLVAAPRRETARVLGLQGAPKSFQSLKFYEKPMKINEKPLKSLKIPWMEAHWVDVGLGRDTLWAKYTSDFSELNNEHGI